MTICLLLSAPILAEGFICILMASPLFYLVGIIVGGILDLGRRKPRVDLKAMILLPLMLSALEGIAPSFSFERNEIVTLTKLVKGTPADVEASLEGVATFRRPLPSFLALGFPHPVSAGGKGLAVGDARFVHFAGGEGKPGDVVARVESRTQTSVRFAIVSDTTHIGHWLTWKESEVAWYPAPDGTIVTWTLRYERRLDPAWYFGPWERYAVLRSEEYLIDTLATPSPR